MTHEECSRRSCLKTLVSAGAIGLAGCSSIIDESASGGDVGTPTPIETGTTGYFTEDEEGLTPTGEDADSGDGGSATTVSPPGISEHGIEDAPLLHERTRERLARSNYEISFSVTIAEEGAAEGSVRSDLDDRKMFVDGGVRDQTYVDGRTTYEKDQSELWTEESDRSFEELHDPTRINFFDRMLPMMLEQGSYSPAETVRRGGRDLRRLTVVDAITTDERLAVTDSSGEAFVSGDGVVFGVRLSREIESENGATTADYSFSIDALGDVSVDRPGWADRAEGNDG